MSDNQNAEAAIIDAHTAGVEHIREINRLAAQIDKVPTTLDEFIECMNVKSQRGVSVGKILSTIGLSDCPDQRHTDSATEAIEWADNKFDIAPTPPLPTKPITFTECKAIYKELRDAARVKKGQSVGPPAAKAEAERVEAERLAAIAKAEREQQEAALAAERAEAARVKVELEAAQKRERDDRIAREAADKARIEAERKKLFTLGPGTRVNAGGNSAELTQTSFKIMTAMQGKSAIGAEHLMNRSSTSIWRRKFAKGPPREAIQKAIIRLNEAMSKKDVPLEACLEKNDEIVIRQVKTGQTKIGQT